MDFLAPQSSLLIGLTDRVRFELTIRGYRIPVFETGAFSLSATCPKRPEISPGAENESTIPYS